MYGSGGILGATATKDGRLCLKMLLQPLFTGYRAEDMRIQSIAFVVGSFLVVIKPLPTSISLFVTSLFSQNLSPYPYPICLKSIPPLV
jgi:hypothetical protein